MKNAVLLLENTESSNRKMNQVKLEMQPQLNKYSNFLKITWQIKNASLAGLVSSLQWDQTNVLDVQDKNQQDMKVMIPVVADTATNLIFII